jgi:hypothetical protein
MSFKPSGNMGTLTIGPSHATILWNRKVRRATRPLRTSAQGRAWAPPRRRPAAPAWRGPRRNGRAAPLPSAPHPKPHPQGVCDIKSAKKITARAKDGVVVGAGRLGLVKKPSSRLASDGAAALASDVAPQAEPDPLQPGGDQDGDGIVGAFDVDDNGNGAVDNVDSGQVGGRAGGSVIKGQATGRWQAPLP